MTSEARYHSAIGALEAAAKFGIHPALDTIACLMRELGDPHQALSCVQVAGTNGKGSTSRVLEALLREAGVRSGAFLSPHLHDYTEQVLIGGQPIEREALAIAIEQAFEVGRACVTAGGPAATQFELLTAAAIQAMHTAQVEWAVLEVGMGGRWDSTSVTTPLVSVVTSVGLDHIEHLGPTLQDIALDKSYVIKAGARACVLGPQTADVDGVFAERARAQGVPVVRVRAATPSTRVQMSAPHGPDPLGASGLVEYEVGYVAGRPLPATRISVLTERACYRNLLIAGPRYQAPNVACAIAAAEAALDSALDEPSVVRALAGVRNPGRFEIVARDPIVIVDGAHNPHGAHALVTAIEEYVGEPVTFVLGVLADKAADLMFAELARIAADFVVTQPGGDRARPASELATLVEHRGGVVTAVAPDVARALAIAREQGRPVVVTGSLRTVAEAREALGLAEPHQH